jgi:nucleotide-binding universal stress UspA family protein
VRILLAIDDSKHSEAATQMLLHQFQREAAEVHVIHVIEPLLIASQFRQADIAALAAAEKSLLAESKKLVARAQDQLRKVGFEAQSSVEEGDPRAVIVERASHWKTDLIILGSHGRKGLDRLLMGSVAEFVAHHAHCSVLIVRTPKSPETRHSNESKRRR